MKNSRFRILCWASFCFLASAICACSPATNCPGLSEKKWIEPFSPGMKMENVRRNATREGYTLRSEGQSQVENRLRIVDFHHLEIFGELRLYFFKDQLFRMRFFPDNPVAYLAAFNPRLAELTRNHPEMQTEVTLVEDQSSGEKYAEWHNECLTQAFNDWVASQATK